MLDNSNSPQDFSRVDDKMISIKVSYSWIQAIVNLKASNWENKTTGQTVSCSDLTVKCL